MCSAWAMEDRQAEQGSAIPYILISLSHQHKALNKCSLMFLMEPCTVAGTILPGTMVS